MRLFKNGLSKFGFGDVKYANLKKRIYKCKQEIWLAALVMGRTTVKLPLFWRPPPTLALSFLTPADALPVDHPVCSSDAGAVSFLSRVSCHAPLPSCHFAAHPSSRLLPNPLLPEHFAPGCHCLSTVRHCCPPRASLPCLSQDVAPLHSLSLPSAASDRMQEPLTQNTLPRSVGWKSAH